MHLLRTRAARTLLALLAILALIPLVLHAVIPAWWGTKKVYHYSEPDVVADASDFSAANQGQLKNMAVAAYEHLIETIPLSMGGIGDMTPPPDINLPESAENRAGTGWRLRDLMSKWVVLHPETNQVMRRVLNPDGTPLEPPSYTPAATGPRQLATGAANDFTAINLGQLKRVADPFYARLNEIYAPFPFPRPWVGSTEPANDFATANLGQLKRVFSFDLAGDSDGDGVSDLDELARMVGGISAPTNPHNIDTDNDGIADGDETQTNPLAKDTDGDGFDDGEDRWPNDGRRGDYIPPKFYAVTDLSAYLPENSPVKDAEPLAISISDEHEVSWVAKHDYLEVTEESETRDNSDPNFPNRLSASNFQTEGPAYHVLTWKDGALTGDAIHLDRTRQTYSAPVDDDHTETKHLKIQHDFAQVKPGGQPGGVVSVTDFTETHDGTNLGIATKGVANIHRTIPSGNAQADEDRVPDNSVGDFLPVMSSDVVGNDSEGNPLKRQTVYPSDSSDPAPDDNPSGTYIEGGALEAIGARTVKLSRNGVRAGTLTTALPNPEQPGYYRNRWRAFLGNTKVMLPTQYRVDDLPPTFSEISDTGNVAIGYEGDRQVQALDENGDPMFEANGQPAMETQHFTLPRNIVWLKGQGGASDTVIDLTASDNGDIDVAAINDQRQCIGTSNTEADEYGYPKAFFLEIAASGTVTRMPLVDLLKWENKPEGTKDDYDKFIKRPGSASNPDAKPQIRRVVPKLIGNADETTAGSIAAGHTFSNGVPRHILMKLEHMDDPSGQHWRTQNSVLDFLAPTSDRVTDSTSEPESWHYVIRPIELPHLWQMDPQKMSESGFLAGFGMIGEGDADGETPMFATPAQLLVDKNHDGKMALSKKDALANRADATHAGSPMVFWLNNDSDWGNAVDDGDWEEDDLFDKPLDNSDIMILYRRDLEDLARLWISFEGMEFLAAAFPEFQITLKARRVKDAQGASLPVASIRVFKAVESDGGIKYLTDSDVAWQQIGESEDRIGQPLKKPAGIALGTLDWLGTGVVGAIDLPRETYPPEHAVISSINSGNPLGYLLFEAVSAGTADFEVELRDSRGSSPKVVAKFPPLRIQIKDVKDMYERWTVDPETNTSQGGDIPMGAAQRTQKRLPTGSPPFAYTKDDGLDRKYILFVHGWNMTPKEKEAFAETAFKRLYWQGYQGKFGVFEWPTTHSFEDIVDVILNTTHYDRGERRAWQSADPLRLLLHQLNTQNPDQLHLLAHSMGNVVAGEALRLQDSIQKTRILKTYVATQAAVPAHCYDGTIANNLQYHSNLQWVYAHPKFSEIPLPPLPPLPPPHPIPAPPINYGPNTAEIYRDWFAKNASSVGRRVNFYNEHDYALAPDAWEFNQITKPDQMDNPHQPYIYAYSDDPSAPAKKSGFHRHRGANMVGGTIDPNGLDLGNDWNTKDRYEIMAFAAEARSKAVGATLEVGELSAVNLANAEIWPLDPPPHGPNGSHGAHKWHSAQFRNTNMRQKGYWKALLGADGFRIHP